MGGAPDDHYHNFCDTTGVDLFALEGSFADDRPVVQCGCCDDEVFGIENIKMSKKGEHCVYDMLIRERELEGDSPRGNVRKPAGEEDY